VACIYPYFLNCTNALHQRTAEDYFSLAAGKPETALRKILKKTPRARESADRAVGLLLFFKHLKLPKNITILRDREPLHWPFSGMAVSQSSGMLLVICSVFNDYDRRIFAAFYRGRTTGQVRSAVG